MVKRSRVLDTELAADAEVPYEETRLARAAAKARPRLALLLLLGAAGFVLEAALTREAFVGGAAAALALVAWGVKRGRLGATIGAAFAALLAVTVPLAFMLMFERAVGEKVIMGFVIAWGAILLPDALTLVRDAELQYAYGRWARRDA